jgi:hypothetical protein
LARAMNEVFVALGESAVDTSAMKGVVSSDESLALPATAAAAASPGSSAVSKAVADAFLLKQAANLATLIDHWNDIMFQAGLTDLTDSTGGSSGGDAIAANTIPSAANGAATTSSPKAGFDTVLQVLEDNESDLATRMNLLRRRYGLTEYTISTGVSADTTLAAVTNNLTAVDGSSGTAAVDQVSARASMLIVQNNISSMVVGINELCDYFGLPHLTNALVGTTPATTIANVPATGTGVGGATGTPTLLDADVDTWLGNCRNNLATLAAKLNAMTGTGVPTKGLTVVAA